MIESLNNFMCKYRYVIIGDSYVGKTKIAETFCLGKYVEKKSDITIFDVKHKTLDIDSKKVNLEIFDTAGTERYRSINQSFYKGVDCAFVVYDVTDRKTFDNVENWIRELDFYQCRDDILIVVLGNKSDLPDRQVSEREGRMLADRLHIMFRETSAKDHLHIKDIFRTTACYLLEKKPYHIKPKDTVDVKKQQSDRRKECCIIV